MPHGNIYLFNKLLLNMEYVAGIVVGCADNGGKKGMGEKRPVHEFKKFIV